MTDFTDVATDIARFAEIFTRANTAISALAGCEAINTDLQAQINGLREELHHASEAIAADRKRGDEAEQTLEPLTNNLSSAKDETRRLTSELDEVRSKLEIVTSERNDADYQRGCLQDDFTRAVSERDALRSERDDYGIRHMQAVDELATYRTRVDQVVADVVASLYELRWPAPAPEHMPVAVNW